LTLINFLCFDLIIRKADILLFVSYSLVFENRLLSTVFEHKRERLTQEWRKLHHKELYNLFSSLIIIIREIKSTRMRW